MHRGLAAQCAVQASLPFCGISADFAAGASCFVGGVPAHHTSSNTHKSSPQTGSIASLRISRGFAGTMPAQSRCPVKPYQASIWSAAPSTDKLLDRPGVDRDFLVSSARRRRICGTAVSVRSAADFPVFLHPETARGVCARAHQPESRSPSTTAFVFSVDPTVTLEQDLERRDLTINAMAEDDGRHASIDPFGGVRDLDRASAAPCLAGGFAEDPCARAPRGAFRRALSPARIPHHERNARADAPDGRRRRSRAPRRRTRLGRNAQGARRKPEAFRVREQRCAALRRLRINTEGRYDLRPACGARGVPSRSRHRRACRARARHGRAKLAPRRRPPSATAR